MKQRTSALFALLTLSICIPQAIGGDQFKVDPRASRVYIHTYASGLGHEHGVEGFLKGGHVVLGATKDAGEWIFDLRRYRVDTDLARRAVGLEGKVAPSEQDEITRIMLGPDVLDVDRYPVAVYRIQSALRASSRQGFPQAIDVYDFRGELELHGHKRPVAFRAGLYRTKGNALMLSGQFRMYQTHFGIRPYRKFLVIGVADELDVRGAIVLEPTGQVTAEEPKQTKPR